MNLESFEVGFNIPAKVGMEVDEIQTPSLIIDYNIFNNNMYIKLIIQLYSCYKYLI